MQYYKNQPRRPLGFPDASIPTAMQERRLRTTEAEYRTEQSNNSCPNSPPPLTGESLAMAFVPYQTFDDLNDPQTALCTGTLFRALDKPFYGQRRRPL